MKTSRFILILLAVLVSGCSDDLSVLNSVGGKLLQVGWTTKTDTLSAAGSSSYRRYGPMNGRINLLGKSGGYTAYEVLEFYPAYFPERDTVLILRATLSLRAETWSGDSSAPWGVNVYAGLRNWGETSFSWDSLTGFYTTDTLRGTVNSTIARDTEWVRIDLDTAMVRNWLHPLSYTGNYGIIMIPTPNTGVVRGFHEFGYDVDSLWPRLTVIAQGVTGRVIDTTVYKSGQDTFVGNIDNLVARPDLMYIQSGVVYRSRLKFDCSSIPRGAIINQAQLLLRCDVPSSRLNKFSSDTAVTMYALVSGTDSSLFESYGSRGSAKNIAVSDTFTLDIRHQVQNWIRDASFNYGLVILPPGESEFSSFDLLTFFNQNAQDTRKRPLLTVTYSVQSNMGGR